MWELYVEASVGKYYIVFQLMQYEFIMRRNKRIVVTVTSSSYPSSGDFDGWRTAVIMLLRISKCKLPKLGFFRLYCILGFELEIVAFHIGLVLN